MPITWDDFDKIWAVSSPLTPYTFSDLNYAAGWNFIGSTPPARQMWDSLQKANDEKFKFLRDNFGTPNMVTTAAQMTDTDKIYVYVGSEAGWNNGHWYYYDADTSTWADGGVYNSTAFVTDTTLTEAGKAADAKAVGDALALKADLAGATFTGNVAVNADFSTTGDATVASDLTVSGATNLTGNVTASGNVSVVGDIDADNITLTGDISATDVTASGDVAAGSLSVSGATTLTGNVTAGANITATGDVIANDASFANATLSGTLSVTGATTLDGLTAGSVSAQSLNTTGNASVGGTLTVSGATTLDSVTADDITASGDITADDITANTLTVSGVSTLSGNVTAGADVTVTGDLSVTNITASGDITADDVTTNGNLSVVGNATLSGVSTAVTPAAEDNSPKIATTAYVQTEIKPIEVNADIVNKRVTNIEKLLQGQLYDYQTDTDSAYTKSVPSGAMPYASLNAVGGKTVVWNQLMPTILTYYVVSGSTDGLTITITDNTLNVVGTTTSAGMIQIQQSAGTIPANHKLFLRKSGSGSGSYNWGRAGFALQGNDAYIQSHTADFGCFIRIAFAADTTYNFTAQFNVTDLTLCYGAGNEPTTVEEFTAQFPAVWYAYNEGSLLSAGVTEVVSKKADTTNLATYPIPAEIQALEGYGWSAGTAYNYIDYERKVFVQNVGRVVVDGNASLSYNSTYDFYTTAANSVNPAGLAWDYKLVNTWIPKPATSPSVTSDLWLQLNGIGGAVRICNKQYTTAESVKAWLTATPITIYYELATPIETDISAYLSDDNLIEVEAGGTLTFPNSNGDDYRIDVPSAETYMVDLQSALGE